MTINKKKRQSVMPPDGGIYRAVFFVRTAFEKLTECIRELLIAY
ncbi:hypothetical protein [Brevibacillus laterosporus]|nr:hypothetical protein [Brevibacillus laterosporus]